MNSSVNSTMASSLGMMRNLSQSSDALASLRLPGAMPLEKTAGQNRAELEAVADKFESMFMNMMLKSMRAVNRVFSEGNFLNSFETGMYEDMLDEQLSESMASSRSLGIANLLVNQLAPQARATSYDLPMGARPDAAAAASGAPVPMAAERRAGFAGPDEFVATLLPGAHSTARALGLPARGLLAQAALETGWGQQMMHAADGSNSHNLFGIKAGADWAGPVVSIKSIEVTDGIAAPVASHFRQYDSYQAAFEDYARFLQGHDRYQQVLAEGQQATGFAQALGESGYATDPAYAEKLQRVMQHPALQRITDELQHALAGGH